MGLFGGMGRGAPLSFMDAEIDPYATSKGPPGFSGPAPAPRRRGLFGRIGAGITPDRLMVLGQTLRDIGTGSNELPDLIAAQREQPFRDMQMQAAKQELGDAQTQRASRQQQQAMIEQYIATLAPEQQAQARVAATLDPEGFAERMTEQTQPSDWQTGPQFTNAFRTRPDGSIEVGGNIPLRPYAAQSGGGGGSAQYQVLSADEVRAQNLPPGSYQRNTQSGQITPIGRTRGQYTEFAGTSAAFASRMAAANDTLSQYELMVDPTQVYAGQYNGGDTNVRRVRQSQREFVNAILRRESGAAIGPNEFDSARQQYFPVPGDPPEVIEQKRQARQRAIMGLVNASQGAYQEWYGDYEPPPDPNAVAEAAPQTGANRPRGAIRGSVGNVVLYDAQGRRLP